MERHGLRFEKRYGQNFLVNPAIPARIAEECGALPEDGILEIGPGIGTLTRELARRYAKVCEVEIDSGMMNVLDETLSDFGNVEIISGDIMKLDLSALLAERFAGMRVSVCANLPYYITTPVIMKLLECGLAFNTLTLMVQKEVAARLTASPGTPEYGALTAATARYCTVKRLFTVSPGSFIPAPKVESAVVKLTLYETSPFTSSADNYRRVVAAAFGQRRKTLLNSLSSALPLDKSAAGELLNSLHIPPETRGEALSPWDFDRIAGLI